MVDDKAKKARNEYMKEWRKKNKDKVKTAQQRYWEKKANIKFNKELKKALDEYTDGRNLMSI